MIKHLLPALLSLSIACGGCATTALNPQVDSAINFTVSSGQIVKTYTLPGDSHGEFIQPLVDYATRMGIPVRFTNLMKEEKILGKTECFGPQNCLVTIDNTQGKNTMVTTLLHELAHARGAAFPGSMMVSEIVAETIAWRAAKKLGLDYTSIYASYMVNFPEDFRRRTIEGWEDFIVEMSDELVLAAQVRTPRS